MTTPDPYTSSGLPHGVPPVPHPAPPGLGGAYPPALSEMMGIFEPWRFSILDVENIRLHYSRTLEHLLERFQNVAGRSAVNSIRASDLPLLNPYFHGTTSRMGAPCCFSNG